MRLTSTPHRPTFAVPVLRHGGCFSIALLLLLCLVGLPSGQASDASLVQPALEDWDETDPVEDKGLLPLSDHQPAVTGACLAIEGTSGSRRMAPVQPYGAASSWLCASSVTRAPPIA